MINMLAIFKSGFVRRWHSNWELADTTDRIAEHGARVARILMAWHPEPSFDLIRAALIHDDGESVTGDMSAPAKRLNPVIAAELEAIEGRAVLNLWGRGAYSRLSESELEWLKFADRLDAYMWAWKHGADLSRNGWADDRRRLVARAAGLGPAVSKKLDALLAEMDQ